MASFRFLHAADLHLDSPLQGLAGQEGGATARIRSAPRAALEALVGLAIAERVAFVVIAGDVYDGEWRDFKTGLFFAAQMGRLNEAGIPVFLIHGNHDAESTLTKRLGLPANVHVFGAKRATSVALAEHDVVLHGQSFATRAVVDNLAAAYPDPVAGAFNIGLLHTGLGGMGGHENYAPCSLADLTGKGYDYWALGHVHQRQVLSERPHVVFAGNLQGRHIRETGPKGATLVTVEDGVVTGCDPVACDTVRWADLTVDVAGVSRVYEAEARIAAAIEDAVAREAEGRLLACRIRLAGRAPAHAALVVRGDDLAEWARGHALGLGDEVAWVEKLVVATDPVIDAATLAERADALGDLQRLIGEAAGDDTLLDQLDAELGEMVRKLPPELGLRPEDPLLAAIVDGDHAALIAGLEPYLLARLDADGD